MKSKKNRTMKTFEEIYRDAAVRNGCNAGKTFARVMFEEGMLWLAYQIRTAPSDLDLWGEEIE